MLSSLVDHKNETAWADRMRAKGVKVGFIGITASKMPELFADHCDFILNGEPEAAVMRLAQGEHPVGIVVSEQIDDLDSLPFPALGSGHATIARDGRRSSGRHGRSAAAIPLLASRGCPEFCTYCPHRILAGYRIALDREHRRRDGAAVRSGSGGRTSSSATRSSPSSAIACVELCDEIQRARPEPHVRGRDAARSARRRAARPAARGRASAR